MSANTIVVAVYDTPPGSVVAKNSHAAEHAGEFHCTSKADPGKAGAHWGGLWDSVFGAASFSIPGLAPMLVAGPLVGWIVAAMEQAIALDGVSAMGAGFCGVAVPQEQYFEIRNCPQD